jgi:hypothetical protein
MSAIGGNGGHSFRIAKCLDPKRTWAKSHHAAMWALAMLSGLKHARRCWVSPDIAFRRQSHVKRPRRRCRVRDIVILHHQLGYRSATRSSVGAALIPIMAGRNVRFVPPSHLFDHPIETGTRHRADRPESPLMTAKRTSKAINGIK